MQLGIPRIVGGVRPGAGFLGLNPNGRGDLLVAAELKQVCNGAPFGGSTHFRDFVNLLDVTAAGLGEKHQVVVRGGGEEMFDEVPFLLSRRTLASRHSDDAFAAAALCAKSTDGGSFDKAAVSD